MAEHTGSSSLFAIFLLSIYSLFLIPYTLYVLCNGDDEEGGQQIWVQGKNKKKGLAAYVQKSLTKSNAIILGLWFIWALLLWYVNVSSSELKPFDPFEILGLPRDAGDREIKKAYRQLSLKFHPDKNPDPKANAFFTEFITKAYQALTDEVSRKNYEKYGHPDGQQAINVGVALPEWIFTKDKTTAPLMLFGLVGCGILLPLVLASWYMLSSTKFAGPNGIMTETLQFYYMSKYSIKESQSLVRIPETLVCAMEFIMMSTTSEQAPAFDELRKMTLRQHPDLKDKALFWKRKASVVKAHMLVLMHMERAAEDVPASLQADLKFVLQKAPVLLEELFKIAVLPRPPVGHGWLTPTVAVVEMMQCLCQGLSVEVRKTPMGKPVDPATVLLQLPFFDADVLKKLKRRKIATIKELQDLDEASRLDALASTGLPDDAARDASAFAVALPTVHARATCSVDDELEIMEQDVVKCKVRVLLTRPVHNSEAFLFQSKGKAVRAFTPLLPVPREEAWYILLADSASNNVYANARVSLRDAEAAAWEHPEVADEWAGAAAGADTAGAKPVPKALATASKFISRYSSGLHHRGSGGNGSGPAGSGADGGAVVAYGGGEGGASSEDMGQLVELMFQAPKAGKYELQVLLLSDCYVGCDKSVSLKLRVMPLTRAAAEGRDAKRLQQNVPGSDKDDQSDAGSRDGSGSEDEDDGGSGEWDSEESGEEETEDEDESEAKEEAKRVKRREGKAAARTAAKAAAAAVATTASSARTTGAAAAAAGDEEEDEEDDEAYEDDQEDGDE